jgi:periplasmic protein CpxP/Spy
MKSIKILVLTCITLLAVGAFAIQYPGGASQGSMQPGHPQTQGSTPSVPGSTQPGQPQTAQPDQQPQAQQQAGRPSIDDQVKMLTQQLNLTTEQQARMKNVLEDQHQQATAIINDSSLAREDKIQKIRGLRENTITRARSMLNDDQKKKLDAMLQDTERMHQQSPSGSPSSSGPGNSGTSSPSSTSPGSTAPSSTPPTGTGRPPQ